MQCSFLYTHACTCITISMQYSTQLFNSLSKPHYMYFKPVQKCVQSRWNWPLLRRSNTTTDLYIEHPSTIFFSLDNLLLRNTHTNTFWQRHTCKCEHTNGRVEELLSRHTRDCAWAQTVKRGTSWSKNPRSSAKQLRLCYWFSVFRFILARHRAYIASYLLTACTFSLIYWYLLCKIVARSSANLQWTATNE